MDFNKAITTIAEYICMTLIVLSIIIYFIVADKIDSENKQKKVNELQNKVEQQIELIDALQQ
jgi:hypothetical protein